MGYYELFAQKIPVKDFSLRYTVESAQPLAFYSRYDTLSNTLTYPTFNQIINVAFKGNEREGELVGVGRHGRIDLELRRRFRLDDKMGHIYKKINTDRFIGAAIKRFYGMRLTLNDPWEAALCFVVSQNNNVKRIRGIVLRLIDKFGQPIKDDNDKIVAKAFPTSQDIASASIEELKECGAGFRAEYIKEAAEFFASNLGRVNGDYYELKEALMSVKGIGDKVADCIALMGFGKLEAFPIDTWAKRVLEHTYFKGRPKNIEALHDFAQARWGKYAGYAQQYLFWYGRQVKDWYNEKLEE
ncbi:MAG: DNA-3-methyladenine glycosylase family protein [Candidatus Micrarchaeia archaeon]